MKKDYFYEVKETLRWYHRIVLWVRRIIGKPAHPKPRYFMSWDIGRTRDSWIRSKIYPDGTIEIVDHGFIQKPESASI
ncbi:MAG: hypothetical protein QM496_13860 [Verrucomicrobiota bacterium]